MHLSKKKKKKIHFTESWRKVRANYFLKYERHGGGLPLGVIV